MLMQLFSTLAILGVAQLGSAAPAEPRALKSLPLGTTFLYELDGKNIAVPTVKSNTGVSINANVYIVDLEGHSASELKRYKGLSAMQGCDGRARHEKGSIRADVGQTLARPSCVTSPPVHGSPGGKSRDHHRARVAC